MKRLPILGVILTGVLLFVAMGSTQSPKLENNQPSGAISTAEKISKKDTPMCNGTTVTTGCILDGVNYKSYIYHPAAAEKTHTETVTTYREEVTGYCTLCGDGTYSPTCATGRGACSHHAGVAEWNAPISTNVPSTSTKTVIDAPAQEAYYEKVAQ